jgi:UDP-N-acetylglucosamine 1-carboxyvinyltransferase
MVGGGRLTGSVRVQGSKNAALALCSAALLAEGRTTIRNVPSIVDVDIFMQIAAELGYRTAYDGGDLEVSEGDRPTAEIPGELGGRIRATACFAASVLARRGRVRFPLPGGDRFCERPIDRHLTAMRLAGAEIEQAGSYLSARLRGHRPHPFKFSAATPHGPSLGATITALLLAATADGTSLISDPSPEPEVHHVCGLLRRCGANIRQRFDGAMEIAGTRGWRDSMYEAPADPSEAGTLALAAAITGGQITMCGVPPSVVPDGFRSFLAGAGTQLTATDAGTAVVSSPGSERRPVLRSLTTGPYPSFPTDLQPLASVLLTQLAGRSTVHDPVFERRVSHVEGLRRFGAHISTHGGRIVIEGPARLTGASVSGTDIRCAAAYLLAGLVADGESTIDGTYHIDRGYEDIVGKLVSLGAQIG